MILVPLTRALARLLTPLSTSLLLAGAAHAAGGGAGGGMPWEAPLTAVLDSITGPVARIVAILIIVATGLTLAFGDVGQGFKKLLQILFGLSDIVLFEMEEIMARPKAAAPALLHLFDRLEERFDGRPTLLVLDEAWLFLDSPLFASRIREWLKTLRKKNVAVVFATQSLADVAGSAKVSETRDALRDLYSGSYAGTDISVRASLALQQLDASRAALRGSLVVQASVTEQLRDEQSVLQRLSTESANATGALSVAQATNEILAFQAEQSMRLQALLVADSRADALERARELEARAQGRAQHEHFFGTADAAHPGQKPWN